MTRQERFELWLALTGEIAEKIPGFKIRYKDESVFQRVLGWLSVWSWRHDDVDGIWHGYDHCTTTIYPVVWFASRDAVVEDWPVTVLEHEYVHLRDAGTLWGLFKKPRKVWAAVWNALYLGFPHGLALLAILAVWGSGWWLLCLLFLLPLPAPFRALSEWRAFARNVELAAVENRVRVAERLALRFTGPSYYFMWPFRRFVLNRLLSGCPYDDME